MCISATGGSSDPTLSDKYRLGFNECAQEVSRYLGASDDDDAELRARLLNHLANCITNSDSPSPLSLPASSPEPLPLAPSINSSTPAVANTSTLTVAPLAPIPVRPLKTEIIGGLTVVGSQGNGAGGSDRLSAAAVLVPTTEINNNIPSFVNSNIAAVVSSSNNFGGGQSFTLTTATSPQAFSVGELQMAPPRTTSATPGEVTFVLPANVMAGGHFPSYIIPVYTSPSGLPANVALTAAAQVHSALPVMGAPQISVGAAVNGCGASPGLLTLSPQSGLQTGVIPPVSVAHVVTGGPLTCWQSAKPLFRVPSTCTQTASPAPPTVFRPAVTNPNNLISSANHLNSLTANSAQDSTLVTEATGTTLSPQSVSFIPLSVHQGNREARDPIFRFQHNVHQGGVSEEPIWRPW